MVFKFWRIALAAALTAVSAAPALAAPLDCPLRDAPFSVDSPFIDILLSPAARAAFEKVAPGKLDHLPPQFAGTKTPTFAAILSLRTAAGMLGVKPEALTALDSDLHALPVTGADRVARCARYDNEKPRFDLPKGKRHILLFQKVNGFFHEEAVPAARAAFTAMAERKGWALAATDKGGAINPATLRQFDVVIWDNNSGDVLTLSQRNALKAYVEKGGGFIAVHGAGGDPAYFWDWYADKLLGARFKAHPMAPQFQDARIVVEAKTHPIAKGLPAEWMMSDEWYSFNNNPRATGANVILTLDESTYKPDGPMGVNLRMGDHPIAWTNCVGKGRAFYSALGHRTETYSLPQNVALLEGAVDWAADKSQKCAPAGGH